MLVEIGNLFVGDSNLWYMRIIVMLHVGEGKEFCEVFGDSRG